MFATVYPLVRLPRRFTFFDYRIPEHIPIHVGDLVRVPFKGRPILGVVRSIETSSTFKRIMPISEVVLPEFLSEKDVQRFETIAWNIVQSPSTVLHAAFRDLTGRQLPLPETRPVQNGFSLSKEDAQAAQIHLASLTTNMRSIQCSNEIAFALLFGIRKQSTHQLLILAPRDGLLRDLTQKLPLGEACYTLHGHTSPREREAIIRGWQSGMIRTLIGSRQVALLPAHRIGHVVILEAGSDDWSHLERNPRIDPRRAASLLARSHDASLVHLSPQPPVEDACVPNQIFFEKKPIFELIRLGAEEERTGIPFVANTTLEAIKTALQSEKSVLLSFNRKGVANRLQCRICDHIPTCGNCGAVPNVRFNDLVCSACNAEMWIPKKCPSCQSDRLSQKGIGNETLKSLLSKRFPNHKVGIIDDRFQEGDADLLLVTEYYFKHFSETLAPKQFGLVAELSFDHALLSSDFRAAEQAGFKLQRLFSLAKQQRATCIVQTHLPDVVNVMADTERFLANELLLRKRYQLPPYRGIASLKNESSHQTETIPLNNETLQELQTRPDHCIITTDTPTYEQPERPQKSK